MPSGRRLDMSTNLLGFSRIFTIARFVRGSRPCVYQDETGWHWTPGMSTPVSGIEDHVDTPRIRSTWTWRHVPAPRPTAGTPVDDSAAIDDPSDRDT